MTSNFPALVVTLALFIFALQMSLCGAVCSGTSTMQNFANLTFANAVDFRIDGPNCYNGRIAVIWTISPPPGNESFTILFSLRENITWYSSSLSGSYSVDPCFGHTLDFEGAYFTANLTQFGANSSTTDSLVPIKLGNAVDDDDKIVVFRDGPEWIYPPDGLIDVPFPKRPYFPRRQQSAFTIINATSSYTSMLRNGTINFPSNATRLSLFLDFNNTIWNEIALVPLSANVCVSSISTNSSIPFSGRVSVAPSLGSVVTVEFPLAYPGKANNISASDLVWQIQFTQPIGVRGAYFANSKIRPRLDFAYVSTPTAPPASPTLGAGPIAGIVIAIIVVLSVVAGAVYFCTRRKVSSGADDRTPLVK